MATKKDPYAKFRSLKQHPDPEKMTPADRRLYGEYLESEEWKYRPMDTPPVSEGPRHFAVDLFDGDGTRLTDSDGNWVGPLSRLAPEWRKYAKTPAKKKPTKAKAKKK